jgi:hypothetical protein
LFLNLVPLSAQDVFSRPLDAESLPRYSAVCADLARHPVIKGVFEQTKTIKRLDRSLVSSGNFIIAAELGMVWDTRLPFPSVTAVGRDFIIQSTPRGRSKIDAGGNETFNSLAATISAIFTGDAQSLKENFENYFLSDGRTWTLGLIPREKAIAVFAGRIILEGSAAPGPALIRSVTLHERNGDIVRYVLSGHSFPAGLSDDEKALFSLD